MNGRLNWVLPIPTITQRPLSHTRVEGRGKGTANWNTLNPQVDVPTATLLIQNISRGEWEFRVIIVDDDGEESKNPMIAEGVVPFDAPSDATEVVFTIE